MTRGEPGGAAASDEDAAKRYEFPLDEPLLRLDEPLLRLDEPLLRLDELRLRLDAAPLREREPVERLDRPEFVDRRV